MVTSTEWHEAAEGHFERALDPVELVFDLATRPGPDGYAGEEQWGITSVIRIKTIMSNMVEQVRQAWVTFRYDEPNIATVIDRERSIRLYKTASEEEVEDWLKETFHIVPGYTVEQLLPTLAWNPRPNIQVLPETQEILFRCSHITIDGMGTLGFWNDLMTLLANPRLVEFGGEAKNLSPAPVNALKPLPPTEQHVQIAKEEVALTLFSDVPSVGLPYTEASRPAKTATLVTKLDTALTQQVVAACKERDYTPTHAVYAALIIATQRLCADSGARHYKGTAAFDLRPSRLPDAQKFNVSLCLMGWTFLIELGSFDSIASKIRHFYTEMGLDGDRLRSVEPWADELVLAATRIATSGIKAPVPASAQTGLNSLGVMERKVSRQYGDIEVDDVWLSVNSQSPGLTTYLWTWKDEMRIRTCYNAAFHKEQSIALLHNALVETLRQGLNI